MSMLSRGASGFTLGAKALAGVLMLGAVGAFLTAAFAFFTLGPESGGVGVVMIDSLFGSFILFIASRFLWIYAVKRERQRELET